MSTQSDTDKNTAATMQVRFDTTDVEYVSQYLVNVSAEDIIVNCSPGYLVDPASGNTIMPIKRRLAMTRPAAQRLAETLLKALQSDAEGVSAPNGDAAVTTSGLPKFN